MADRDPLSDMFAVISGPFTATMRSFDQLRRGAEELIHGFENFNSTMKSLNETAERVNRLLNDVEEPIRAALPQVTRSVKLFDDMSRRMSDPLERVIPGLDRLADTLSSPVFSALPHDLMSFLEVLNDLRRRMGPLGQLAESAGGLFGFRLPGMGAGRPQPGSPTPPTPPVVPARPDTDDTASTRNVSSLPRPSAAKKSAAKKTPANRPAAKKSATKKTFAKKKRP